MIRVKQHKRKGRVVRAHKRSSKFPKPGQDVEYAPYYKKWLKSDFSSSNKL